MRRPVRRFIPRAPAARAAIGLVLGFAAGFALAAWPSGAAQTLASALDAIGAVWVNAIRMTVVPLVVSLLISTIAREADLGAVGRMGRRAVAIFVVMLVVIGALGLVAGPPLFAPMHLDATSAAALRASAAASATRLPGFASWLVSLAPANPVRAAADGAILPLIVFALCFALALARTAPAQRAAGGGFFGALAAAMLVIVKWVLALAPFGVFAIAVPLAMRVGPQIAGVVAYFLLVHCGLLVVSAAAFYPVARLLGGVPVRTFARAALPAQVVAFSTRSSVAALPVMIEAAENVLQIPSRIAGFALPFAVSLARVNTGLSWIVSAIFIGKLYGMSLTVSQLALLGAMAVPMSFSVPGIPSAGLVIIATAFLAVGLPVEGIGILIAVDAIPDIFKTSVNVTAHMTTAVLLARYEPAAEVRTAVLAST